MKSMRSVTKLLNYIKMRNFSKIHFFSLASLGLMLIVALSSMFMKSKGDGAKYMISTSNQKVYYTNSFRMIGRGVMFDDVYGKSIILVGNIDIEYRKP